MTDRDQYRRVRLVFSAIGIVVGLVGLWGFTGGALELIAIGFFVLIAGVPFGMYVIGIRSKEGSIGAGAALIAVVVLVQLSVSSAWSSGSSTAPIGYYWLPVAGSAVVGIVAFLERARI